MNEEPNDQDFNDEEEEHDGAKCPFCGSYSDETMCEHLIAWWDEYFASEDDGFLDDRIYEALSDFFDVVFRIGQLLESASDDTIKSVAKELSENGFQSAGVEAKCSAELSPSYFADTAYDIFRKCAGQSDYEFSGGVGVGMACAGSCFYSNDIDSTAESIKKGFAPTVKVLEEIAAHFKQLRPASEDD